MSEPVECNWEGRPDRRCGDHRTVGVLGRWAISHHADGSHPAAALSEPKDVA